VTLKTILRTLLLPDIYKSYSSITYSPVSKKAAQLYWCRSIFIYSTLNFSRRWYCVIINTFDIRLTHGQADCIGALFLSYNLVFFILYFSGIYYIFHMIRSYYRLYGKIWVTPTSFKCFLIPLQRTGMFPSLYLIIKGKAFPWFGPFVSVVPSFVSSVVLSRVCMDC
jgi:hypothetical protein